MNESLRDTLGRIVRIAWVRWAHTQPNPKPHWLAPFDELAEPDKEADRQIGQAVFDFINDRRIELATKASRDTLTTEERDEFDGLQKEVFDFLATVFPTVSFGVDQVEKRLENSE